MLIQEIILENFMSYEYARIPLKSGVNIICGPNGAGKSSILLGISIAMGQSYTERSKKLSDLIRWGKDQGRVTLVLDNLRRRGHRPVRKINKDQIFLSRVLRRDGNYWFELDNRSAAKSDVVRLLSHFEVDPENMLIIMHQDMAEQFIVLSPQEKLKLVEAAVGLEPYRRNVSEAQRKLSRILSQEESLGKLLESAEQTLNYWREQYERYQQKKQLILQRRFLERELAWAEVSKRERKAQEIQSQIKKIEKDIGNLEDSIKNHEEKIDEFQNRMEPLKNEWRRLIEERLSLEGEKIRHEFGSSSSSEYLKELQGWLEISQKEIGNILEGMTLLEDGLKRGSNPGDFEAQLTEIRGVFETFQGSWTKMLDMKIRNMKEMIEKSKRIIIELDAQISDVLSRMEKRSMEIEGLNNEILEKRISLALFQYQKRNLSGELEGLNGEHKVALADLEQAVKEAKEMGPQIVALRNTEEIMDEIRMVDSRITALADVSEDIERMYESYSKLYLELKEKARLVAENREKTLEEIKTRMESWRKVVSSLLEHITLEYQRILTQASADGSVQFLNVHDIEAAGIEILVGFRGAKPVPLNIYTQSGGERSTATMGFLLALQQHVRSSFRAIDEYDVHMDPKNREMIANLLIASIKGQDAQYLAITPNQMLFEGKDVHIITVQNVEGTSVIKEAI